MAAFTVIEHDELSGSASSWEETSISASYDHLLLVASMRSDVAAHLQSMTVQLNGETGSTNYSYTTLYADTATPGSEQYTNQATVAGYPRMPGTSATGDTFGTMTIWIPNYSNTANFKQVLVKNGSENASTSNNQWYVMSVAGLWSNTAAINQITVTAGSGNFVQYSTFTLYGVTGA